MSPRVSSYHFSQRLNNRFPQSRPAIPNAVSGSNDFTRQIINHNGSRADHGNDPSIAKELKSAGMELMNSDKSPGSCVTSAPLMLDTLHATKTLDPSKPHIYLSSSVSLLSKLRRTCIVMKINLMPLVRARVTTRGTPWHTD